MLADELIDSQGIFTVLNAPPFAADTTTLRFETRLRHLIGGSELFGGQLQLRRMGSLLLVSGSGDAMGQGVFCSGTGQFVPDNGSTGSGELTVSVTVSDGPSPPSSDSAPATHCKVPKLGGKTVSRSRAALRKAHCRLGKVKKPRGKEKRLVVVSQSIHANRTMPAGTKVNVTLGKASRH